MLIRKGKAYWKGDLKSGHGEMDLSKIDVNGNYSFLSRFENGKGTNPEELIAAAHAGCFSMAFANTVAGKGFTPDIVSTVASVYMEKGDQGFYISGVHLDCKATVPGIDNETFQASAEEAKKGCPVSKALAAVNITLEAVLE